MQQVEASSAPGSGVAPLTAAQLGEIDTARAYAIEQYSRGAGLSPPPDLQDREQRERWRFRQGSVLRAQALMDPGPGSCAMPAEDVCRRLARGYIGAVLYGISFSVDEADRHAAEDIDQAMRLVELAAESRDVSHTLEALMQQEGDPATPGLEIIRARSVTAMQDNQPDPIVAPLLYRGRTTLISGAGGAGKTTLAIQICTEVASHRALWGLDELRPARPNLRVLYCFFEDPQSSCDYWCGRVLSHYGLDSAPFDMICIYDGPGQYPLHPGHAGELARLIQREQYDLVVLDPLIAALPEGLRIIDPAEARHFQRSSIAVLERSGAAILIAAHDNKAGQAVAGTADWCSFARTVLHLEAAGSSPDGDLLSLSRVKANFGWRYEQIELLRDPRSLVCEVRSVRRLGDPGGGSTAAVAQLLAQLVRTQIVPLPSERRTKSAVEVLLRDSPEAQAAGIRRQQIRDFIAGYVRFDERRAGRTVQHIVTGVRDEDLPS